jgi:hypothetical protein
LEGYETEIRGNFTPIDKKNGYYDPISGKLHSKPEFKCFYFVPKIRLRVVPGEPVAVVSMCLQILYMDPEKFVNNESKKSNMSTMKNSKNDIIFQDEIFNLIDVIGDV